MFTGGHAANFVPPNRRRHGRSLANHWVGLALMVECLQKLASPPSWQSDIQGCSEFHFQYSRQTCPFRTVWQFLHLLSFALQPTAICPREVKLPPSGGYNPSYAPRTLTMPTAVIEWITLERVAFLQTCHWARFQFVLCGTRFATIAPSSVRSFDAFRNQLLWREFAHSTLWDRPELLDRPFRQDFLHFPWRKDEADWLAWMHGTTGYPVVDAAARQLLTEGWVHNRARMVAASFLTKHLMIDFRLGEKHYLEQLVDADMANNDMGWQWSAGCGCDAQPYIRVFNPTVQGERFDPDGQYVRRWVPELARLPAKYIHRPASAPSAVLRAARVVLGKTYPAPRIDHVVARGRFLQIAESYLRGARAGKGG